jgi:uncharacterized protein YwqG
MTQEEIRDRFAAWRKKHARPAWKPTVREDDATGISRFGGSPILAVGEEWPRCSSCGQPMQFFLQLELARFPAAFAHGDGLLQLFYCSTDAGDCETWAPFSGTHLARITDGKGAVAPHPEGIEPFPPRALIGWEEFRDEPHPEEHEALGVHYEYDFKAKRVSVRCDEFGIALDDLDIDLDVAEATAQATAGDKLGGWPFWVQSAEYPSCPTCKTRMELVLQVDSENNVPHMFGDAGCGHITQCPVHRDVLTFGWACG